jgi:hypothetical protein
MTLVMKLRVFIVTPRFLSDITMGTVAVLCESTFGETLRLAARERTLNKHGWQKNLSVSTETCERLDLPTSTNYLAISAPSHSLHV